MDQDVGLHPLNLEHPNKFHTNIPKLNHMQGPMKVEWELEVGHKGHR